MKSYTDLEQSKKLSEILPLESADMWYSYYGNSMYNPTIAYKGQQWFLCQIRNSLHDDIPCWSLTALLNVLPRIDIEKEIYSDDTYEFRVIAYIGDGYIGDWYNNPIDACFNMIMELYEDKML